MDYGTPLATDLMPASAMPAVTMAASTPTVTLTASTRTITQGDTVSLDWSSAAGATLLRSNFGAAAAQGTIDLSPIKTTTYQLTIADGTQRATAKGDSEGTAADPDGDPGRNGRDHGRRQR